MQFGQSWQWVVRGLGLCAVLGLLLTCSGCPRGGEGEAGGCGGGRPCPPPALPAQDGGQASPLDPGQASPRDPGPVGPQDLLHGMDTGQTAGADETVRAAQTDENAATLAGSEDPADGDAAGAGDANATADGGRTSNRPTAGTDGALPVVRVEGREATHDFGVVGPGTEHRVVFEIPNPSTRPLKIVAVRTDCECIAAGAHPDVIPAGEAGRFEAILEAPEQAIPYTASLLVVTDDPARRMITLSTRSRTRK